MVLKPAEAHRATRATRASTFFLSFFPAVVRPGSMEFREHIEPENRPNQQEQQTDARISLGYNSVRLVNRNPLSRTAASFGDHWSPTAMHSVLLVRVVTVIGGPIETWEVTGTGLEPVS